MKNKLVLINIHYLKSTFYFFCKISAPHHHHDEEEEGDETTLRILNNLNNSTVVQVIKDNGVNGVHNIITDLQNFCGAHCVWNCTFIITNWLCVFSIQYTISCEEI